MWPFATKKTKELIEDVVARREGVDLDDMFDFVDEEFLTDLGADELTDVVTKMLQDDQVSAEMETFKTFVGNSNYIVQPSDEKDTYLAEKYQEYLSRDGGHLVSQFENFFEALEFGAVICQTIWKDPKDTGGVWVIDKLKPMDHTRYGFNKRGQMVDRQGGFVLDAPYKYVSVSHNVRGGNLNGNSLLLKAYWPWTFRKACIRAGLLYVKKSVIPSIIAIYKAGKNKTEIEAQGAYIAKELSRLANSSGIAMANVESVQSIDATSKGTDIIDLVELFNRMISKAIFGVSTLTNESRFSSNDTAGTSREIIEARAKKVNIQEFQPTINTLLRWTAELNEGDISPEKLPFFKYIFEYDPQFAEVISAVETGIAVSGKWFYNKFNIKPPEQDDILVEPRAAVAPIVARSNGDGFFLHSEHRTNRPELMNRISTILRNTTGEK